jgi:hypothetical protein
MTINQNRYGIVVMSRRTFERTFNHKKLAADVAVAECTLSLALRYSSTSRIFRDNGDVCVLFGRGFRIWRFYPKWVCIAVTLEVSLMVSLMVLLMVLLEALSVCHNLASRSDKRLMTHMNSWLTGSEAKG